MPYQLLSFRQPTTKTFLRKVKNKLVAWLQMKYVRANRFNNNIQSIIERSSVDTDSPKIKITIRNAYARIMCQIELR